MYLAQVRMLFAMMLLDVLLGINIFNLALMQAVIRDKRQPTRRSKQIFVRRENVILADPAGGFS